MARGLLHSLPQLAVETVGDMRKSAIAFLALVFAGCSMNDGDEVDRLFAEYRPDGTPGASIMVIRDGQIEDVRSYGIADMETGSLVSPSTNFRLASITKQFHGSFDTDAHGAR